MPVIAGTYNVKITYQGKETQQQLNVLKDPLLPITDAQMAAKDEMIKKHYDNVALVTRSYG